MNTIRSRTILAFTVPLVVSQSVILLNGIIDLAIVGPLWTPAVAAVSVSAAICTVLFNFLEGFRTGTTVLVSGAAALGDEPRIRDVFRTALFLSAAAGSAIFPAAHFIGSAVFAQHDAASYLTIWLRTVPVVLFFGVLTGLLRGLGDTVTPAIVSVAVCALNAFLSYLLVYGGHGLPAMGVTGSAWGTLIAESAGLATLTVIVMRKKLTSRYMRLSGGNFRFREFIPLAADVGCNSGFTLTALLIFVFILRGLGVREVAVHQITLQIFNLAYLPAMGFLIAATIVIPRFSAAGRSDLIIKAAKKIAALSFFSITVVCGAVFIFANHISSFFSPSDPAVAECSARTIRLVCAGELFCSVYMVMRGVLTGCGDSRFVFYEGIVSGYIIFLPLAYLLTVIAGLGVFGGYCAFVVWCGADCLALSARFRMKTRASVHSE